ncbi:MAG TPA: 50S ribosomal protein L21e [Candidatus Syntrophoarchaeum butanivorans]|uniref:Large ribosomal subunit protein eL21 n=1 Tax=Candidatus Syntropharchaeum butanivorans TaxID=1839936 RepID=A0A1F2P4K6_9EURY|nr:MAG: 50S ribosomal protein L21 [Candidatus Syntrophoarchaeum butanivorans]RJS71303.1 MAG: 50S ribosomal protein L21e [Candidatus Syntrophoarchaeum sp. WYZ-LMO15]HDM35855.1 50S ribosomal protein L21e [Candidatus Syntrophoarchaeum butanivorans]HEC56477.1 50S ribosomal protein L21e [Candidatus Syntrophoarchaeum butanivorans]
MPVSHGVRRKSRHKLRKKVRERGISPVTRAIQEFEPGEMVHIRIDPSVHRGMPNPKFHGKTARVIGMRGRAFRLEVRDGNKMKEIFVRPEHLLPQK